jgi:cysteine desulfurase
MKPSHVLGAMGLEAGLAANMIRVSIGWNTTPEELERFADVWASLA